MCTTVHDLIIANKLAKTITKSLLDNFLPLPFWKRLSLDLLLQVRRPVSCLAYLESWLWIAWLGVHRLCATRCELHSLAPCLATVGATVLVAQDP